MADGRALTCEAATREALFRLEIWGAQAAVEQRLDAALPAPCRATPHGDARLIWWEPSAWLIRSRLADAGARRAALEFAAGDDGAVTEVSGGFRRLRVQGEAWRSLLMIGGVFDAESSAFAPGCVAGTVIHHLPVWLDVIDAETIDAYTPSSYAAELERHWERSMARLGAAG